MTQLDVRTFSTDRSDLRTHALTSVLRGQRTTYLIGGAVTVAVYSGLLALGLLILEGRVPYLFLVAVSHLLAVIIVYPWYRLVVFRTSRDPWIRGCLRFYAVGLSFLLASLAGLPLLVELAGLPVLLAQLLVLPASTALSYAINRSWAFRDRTRAKRW
ncbi:GtrA family protein [Planomonospora corallina]|uniref:GtrA family protein n=1 Tax=Planomonospora corallina TaxID=1806052 RepID=A0ABV8I0Y0_9ACTN